MAAPASPSQTRNTAHQAGLEKPSLPRAAGAKAPSSTENREPALLPDADAKPIDPPAGADSTVDRPGLVKLLNSADLSRGKHNGRLLDDPSLAALPDVLAHLCSILADNPSPRDITNPKQRVETAAHLARNLFFTGTEVSSSSVAAAFAEYEQLKEHCSAVPLFAGRSIIYIAGYQKVDNDPEQADRFGRDAAFAKLQKLAGSTGSVRLIKPKDASPAAAAEAKALALAAIAENRPGPEGSLVIFDCHGTPGYFVLSGDPGPLPINKVAEHLRSTAISTDELGAALRTQAARYPVNTESHDLLLALTCYSHDNLRQLGTKLPETQRPLLALAIAEYGQLGYSKFSTPEGNQYLQMMLDLPADRATVGGWMGALNFIDKMTTSSGRQLFGPRLPSNPSVFLLQPGSSTPVSEQKDPPSTSRMRQLSGGVRPSDVCPAGHEEEARDPQRKTP